MNKKQKEKQKIKYGSAKERIVKHESGFSQTAVKLPDGAEWMSFSKKGTYRIDIIPYVVGKGNPFCDEGILWPERTYWIHRVGPENKPYCCLAKTFHKRCPVCDERARLMREGADKDLVKSLKPSERQLWNVKNLDEPDKGIMILDQSNFLFGALIDAKVSAADDEDQYENYFHLDGGYTLKLTIDQESFEGRSFFKCTNIEMKPRKTAYDDSILDEVVCLDDCLIEVSYDKLKAIFLQDEDSSNSDSDDDSEDDEPTPARKATSRKKPDPDEDEDDEDDSPPKKTTSKKPVVDDEDDDDEPEDPSDLENDDDSDDEPVSKKPSRKKPDPDEDEDDDQEDGSDLEDSDSDSEDDDTDDEPTPAKRGRGRPKGSKNKK